MSLLLLTTPITPPVAPAPGVPIGEKPRPAVLSGGAGAGFAPRAPGGFVPEFEFRRESSVDLEVDGGRVPVGVRAVVYGRSGVECHHRHIE